MTPRPRIRQDAAGIIHIEVGSSGRGRCGVDIAVLRKGFRKQGHGCAVCFHAAPKEKIRLRPRRSR